MEKLATIGIDPCMLKWFSNYLSNGTQFVGVNGEASDSVPVISGVPQGSVLGPTLFLIYINGITDISLSDGSKLLYADDLLLYRAIRTVHDYAQLQQDINSLDNWIQQKYLLQCYKMQIYDCHQEKKSCGSPHSIKRKQPSSRQSQLLQILRCVAVS